MDLLRVKSPKMGSESPKKAILACLRDLNLGNF
jgi:hypothetical protein